MPPPVADLHCDLLAYLASGPGRDASDARARCSIPQLREGGVRLQVLAIFVVTGGTALDSARRQVQAYRGLVETHPDALVRVRDRAGIGRLFDGSEGRIGTLAAFENASGFCDEHEPIAEGLDRFERYADEVGPLAYVSLTWNDENRFGGGNLSSAGLTDDGRRMLDRLAARNVAVDLSHASDALAEGVLRHLAATAPDAPVMASHSNHRTLCDVPRNLPPGVAEAIAARGGVIGTNFIARFTGAGDAGGLVRQVRRGLTLGDGSHAALGADFFFSGDLPAKLQRSVPGPAFVEGFDDSASYPRLFDRLATEGVTVDEIEAVAWRNAARFLGRNLDRASAAGANP